MGFLGRDGKPLIAWEEPAQAWRAFTEITRGRPCDQSGITYEKLRGGSGIQWPCTDAYPAGTERLYADQVFPTRADYCEEYGHDLVTGAENEPDEYRAHDPGGRALLKAAEYLPPHEPINEDYPFQLTTGRTVYHWHTRTKTARVGQLDDAAPRMWVELHGADAEQLGIGEGDLVWVRSPRGVIEAPARLSGTRPGVVFAPFHYGNVDGSPDDARTAANELTRTEWDPVSKQPTYKVTAVAVERAGDGNGETAPVNDVGATTVGGTRVEAVSTTAEAAKDA